MPLHPLILVILCGGTGMGLWHFSRETHLKPFMRKAEVLTLLHKTYSCALHACHGGALLTVTKRKFIFASCDERVPTAPEQACDFCSRPPRATPLMLLL